MGVGEIIFFNYKEYCKYNPINILLQHFNDKTPKVSVMDKELKKPRNIVTFLNRYLPSSKCCGFCIVFLQAVFSVFSLQIVFLNTRIFELKVYDTRCGVAGMW